MALTKISGNVIKDSVSLSGNVSIGGTLTYEDVTNVDSIGLITARSGINISDTTQSSSTTTGALRVAGGVGIVKNLHVGGTITGNGSGLTGVSGVSVANQADNRLITATGTTDALNGESNLTFDGTQLQIGGDSSVAGTFGLEIYNTDSNEGTALIAGTGGARLDIMDTGSSERLRIAAAGAAYFISYKSGDPFIFQTTNGSGTAERLRIDSSGFIKQKFTSNNSTTAEGLFINNLNNGTGNNASLILSNDSGERKKAAIALIDTGNYGAGDLVFALDGADSGELHLTNDEKLRIDSSGHIHTGYTSGFGNDHINILATDGGGVAVATNNVGNASANDILGSYSFQGYLSGAAHGSAEAKISAIAAANHTGSSAATDMVFYTKPSTTGPGSAPTERFRISSNGNLEWRNRSVKQRKSGAFLGINNAGTSDIKISGNFENNDMIRVRWAYNWNAGDGGAWGEAVIWKQYEGTKRVRYLTDVKASPLTSVSFPHSGNDIWLRWQTNAGINGWYMIDVECHGCEPFPF